MPARGIAKVVFVRSPGARYARFAVHDGDRLVAIVSHQGFGVCECDPGHHLFSATLGNVAVLEGDLLPNRIYYVEVHETHGWVSPGVEMHSIYPNSADHKWKRLAGWLNRASEVAPDEADILHDRKGIDHYMSRVQNYRQKKYLTNPHREQILPECGQLTPIGSR